MTDYQPTSRRPIADAFRATARRAVELCVRANVHPDTISYLSIVAAGLAGIAFWQSRRFPALLIAAPLLCYLRLWFNMLDGMVALASGNASKKGEIVNELPDRVSDILVFAGVAHSGWCHPLCAYWAMILALLTAYVGTLGQAVAGRREFGGIMSKPWRMVALHIGAWTTYALIIFDRLPVVGSLTLLDWTNLLIIVGCIQTVWVRLRNTLTHLN